MQRSTIVAVVAAALSTAAMAQVGTDLVDNKVPANQTDANTLPPADAPPPTDVPPSTDDAPASDRADAPATVTPTPGDPTGSTSPPPKRAPR